MLLFSNMIIGIESGYQLDTIFHRHVLGFKITFGNGPKFKFLEFLLRVFCIWQKIVLLGPFSLI